MKNIKYCYQSYLLICFNHVEISIHNLENNDVIPKYAHYMNKKWIHFSCFVLPIYKLAFLMV